MKKLALLVAVVALAIAFGGSDAFAGKSKKGGKSAKGGIVTKSIGTYGPVVFPGDGELLTCDIDEGLSPVSQTFYFINGVCDDRGTSGLPACGGRYVAYGEECSSAADGHAETSGTVISRDSGGIIQVCFADPAAGEADCAAAIPAISTVISVSTTQSHTNHVSGTEILLGVAETNVESESKWTADGEERRWSKTVGKRNIVHSQAQINGGTCPAIGPCGLSSTGIRTK